ncbi:MAG: hypothetical protein E6J54_19940 [Deltaproteobacteria bacterium]|nr:MAG: hypothetical protein E6J54_19940 [Deltaproteobacteria bacterium]
MKLSVRGSIHRLVLGISAAVSIGVLFTQLAAHADPIPKGWQASNMKAIGYSGLDGRGGAFKMAIRQVAGRWYLYMGHEWHRGWSILDVTDPTNPKYVKFVEGPDNTNTIQMEFHDNIMVTALQRKQPNWGGDPNRPNEEGVLIWDISDPVNWTQLSHWKTGSTGVHRIGYPGGKYVNLTAAIPGYLGRILVFLDISDPKNPKEAGRWWMPGQKEGEQPKLNATFHGPAIISDDGKTAYMGYGPAVVILDISDISKPKLIGQLTISPPFGGIPAHDVLPIPGKNMLFVHGEATGGGDTPDDQPACARPITTAAMVDIKDPAKPYLVSILPTPVPPEGAPYTDFCDKGGRFGPHNTNLEYHLPDVEKQADLIYLTYFNAGLRIYDIKNPRLPKEIGWFIPPTPTKRYGPLPYDKLVSQTEDVLVDTRGNIYITDKNWGIFVLRYTGPGQPKPTAK